jgi:hypothetical protein
VTHGFKPKRKTEDGFAPYIGMIRGEYGVVVTPHPADRRVAERVAAARREGARRVFFMPGGTTLDAMRAVFDRARFEEDGADMGPAIAEVEAWIREACRPMYEDEF